MSKWPTIPFTEAIQDVTSGNKKLLSSDYRESGLFPIVDQGKSFIAGYSDDECALCKEEDPVIIFGDHTKIFKYVDFRFCMGADGVKVLKCRTGFNPRFVYHFLKTIRLPENVGYSRHFKFLKEALIPKPTIEEQKYISAALDKAESLHRKRQQAILLADDFLRATFLDMFGDPLTNPKHWPEGTIRDLVTSVNYGTSEKADEKNGEYPILRMMNITYEGRWNFDSLKYIDLSERDKEKYLAKPGDLLFNRTNSKELVGKAAVFEENREMAIAGYLIRVRTNNKANPYYISAYLNSKHGKQTLYAMCKSIVGMANINAQELQDIRIQIPPIELQNEYAEIIAAMRKRELLMRSSESQLAELFASLNNQFFLN